MSWKKIIITLLRAQGIKIGPWKDPKIISSDLQMAAGSAQYLYFKLKMVLSLGTQRAEDFVPYV